MSGVPHSIVRARASATFVSLERQAVVVSGIVTPDPGPLSPYLRGQGFTIELTALQVTNPADLASAVIRIVLVRPNGSEYNIVNGGTLLAHETAAFIVPMIEPGENIRADLLPASDPGARIDVMSTWADVDVVKRVTKELEDDYTDLLVGENGRVLVTPLFGGMADPGPNLDIDLRVVDEDGETYFFRRVPVTAGFLQLTNFGPTLKPGQRLQARAAAGTGLCFAFYLERPEVH